MSYNVNEVIGMTDRDKTREELSAKLAEAVRESNIPEISDPEEVKRYLLENGMIIMMVITILKAATSEVCFIHMDGYRKIEC